MLRKLLLFLMISLATSVPAQISKDGKMNVFITNLMSKMTLEEKIGQLNLPSVGFDVTGPILSRGVEDKIKRGFVGGVFNTYTPAAVRKLQEMAVNQTRLKIPLLFGYDVIHGHKTIFPIALGLASSWDMNAVERSARIAAREASADGLNWTFSPMVDIARDARWGRISEGAGEDPYLGSYVATAMVRGYQGNDLSKNDAIMACVKHFALYGAAEAGRDYNTVDMSPVKMYNEYLAPYKAAIDAGAATVMTSFNEINGVPATTNKWLLTDLLRKQWGFKGFVVTDYTAINETVAHGVGNLQEVSALSLKAGVDMDMVGEGFLNTVKRSLEEKKITQLDIDLACRRILEAKYKLGLFDDPYRGISEERAANEILSPANRQAAREISRSSMVLLKNNAQLLPLNKSVRIALIGPLANNQRDMIGSWSAAGDWKKAVSVMQGIKNVAPNASVRYAKGCNILDDSSLLKQLNAFGGGIIQDTRPAAQMINEAVEIARQSDVIVAVLGESSGMSGEAASRSELNLPGSQRQLLEALLQTGKPVVLVLMNGRPLALQWENDHVPAILESWFGGTEAGNAVADILFGDYNPSGKITNSFPRSVGQEPIYYNHKNTGRPYAGNVMDKYKSRYLDVENDPLYPFGYGLSYTRFSYSDINISSNTLQNNGSITATVTVSNVGNRDGEEVVQMYIRDMVGSITRPVKELKGFRKIFLKAGESQQLRFVITPNQLRFYNADLNFVAEPGDFRLYIGSNSRDVKEAGFTLLK
ncbi:MAG: beta-D-glucoside glucohydrolase [Chitinophagaceae bacterium]|nr:beta-D-glucoside glucohydrolase [Chitinophagaceae bacterium]